jgi:hypothetical protein
MEVLDHRFSGSKLSFEVKYESLSKTFRDYSHWVSPRAALLDFEDDTNANMLVEYALLQQESDPVEGGKLVDAVKNLIRRDKKLKKKYESYYLQEEPDKSTTEDSCGKNAPSCANKNHNNPLDRDVFELVPYCSYWAQGSGFLHGSKCGKCKTIISASGINKPAPNREVAVCKTIMKTKLQTECCGNVGIWCNECAQKQSSACGGGRRKRG